MCVCIHKGVWICLTGDGAPFHPAACKVLGEISLPYYCRHAKLDVQTARMCVGKHVWYGMVWPGLAWPGLAWHGLVWYGMCILYIYIYIYIYIHI